MKLTQGPQRVGLGLTRSSADVAADWWFVGDDVLAIPINDHPWISQTFFENEFGLDLCGSRRIVYVDPVVLAAAPIEAIAEMINTAEPNILITESHSSDAISVGSLFCDAGCHPIDLTSHGSPAAEFYYCAELVPDLKSGIDDSVVEAIRSGSSEIFADGISISSNFSEPDIHRLWSVYDEGLGELGLTHPMRATYHHDDFKRLLTDDWSCHATATVDNQVASIMLMTSNLELCTWLDPDYFATTFTKQWERGQVLVIPGIVSDPDLQGLGYIGSVLKYFGDVLAVGGCPTLLTFLCNNQSREYTPAIVQSTIASQPAVQGQVREFASYLYTAWGVTSHYVRRQPAERRSRR